MLVSAEESGGTRELYQVRFPPWRPSPRLHCDSQSPRRRDHHGHRVSSDHLSFGASGRGLGGWTDSHLFPLRCVKSANYTPEVEVRGEIRRAGLYLDLGT